MEGFGQGVSGDPERPQSASQKTLAVLEAALLNKRFTDIVDGAQLPKSTVHRILAFLTESGFIAGDAELGFRAGRRFTNLAGHTLSTLDISELAQPVVDSLVGEVECTVHIGAAAADEAVYVLGTESKRPYRVRSRVGRTLPMHSTGMGKAVLAYRDQQQVRHYAERTGLPALTDATLTDVDALLAELSQVHDRGYALDLGEHEVGTVCVSAPIFNHLGDPAYGISISSLIVSHPGTSIERLAPRAVEAAAEISYLLGAQR